MRSMHNEFVRLMSEAALLMDNPKRHLHTLDSIPGVGGATATVILAFYDPTNYAVADRYIVDALFGEDRKCGLATIQRFSLSSDREILETSTSAQSRKRSTNATGTACHQRVIETIP